MLKIGVFGAGQLGQLHIKCLQELNNCNLVGFYESDDLQAEITQKKLHLKRFTDFEEFLKEVDVMDVVESCNTQFRYLEKALKNLKHLFINKFALKNLSDIASLINLSKEANVYFQIGQSERYNPTYICAVPLLQNPLFIESNRSIEFNNTKRDVDVIMDLMLKDIESILGIVNSPIKKISANGFNIYNSQIDVANARLEFDNGCIANLTASRIAQKETAKSHFLQKDKQIELDYLNDKIEVLSMNGKHVKETFNTQQGDKSWNLNENIKIELESFLNAIETDTLPFINVNESYQTLEIANTIISKINNSANNLS